jgi:hypothetical protein
MRPLALTLAVLTAQSLADEDHPAATYVGLGVQGKLNPERLLTEMATFRTWLDSHKDEWVANGEPRRLGYRGPMTPEAQRL